MGLYDQRGYLFSDIDLRATVEHQRSVLQAEVDSLEQNRLLNTSEQDLIDYFVEKYTVEPPVLLRDDMTADQRETKVDARHHGHRLISDTSRPFYIPGQQIDIEIPFTGEANLFKAQASTFSSAPPQGRVSNQTLILSYQIPHDMDQDIKPQLERQLQEIEKHLEWIRNDLRGYNNSIAGVAETAIRKRRDRLLANQGRVAALGIPLKVRGEAPKTYAAPAIRKKVAPTLPKASTAPFEPEPTMSMEHYEHVLTVVHNMTQMMERSPSTFATMGEEVLRDHYLVQLNGQFEGQATGETFNAAGKTDILLRIEGKNAFIGECKFWKGAKGYRETIDQLLSYQSWRDTKTAILVFSRNRDTSKVLEEIKKSTEVHPHYKRTIPWKKESGFRFVMHHPSDANRELIMTVLVFDIPDSTTDDPPKKDSPAKKKRHPLSSPHDDSHAKEC
ncbi:hypothetical protein RS982_06040 [Stenotrophomonas indicatrix]|jgi:hypothetical protein|uniref:hypothetical protein n=2 Tax=Gammaproteobacteria TaxID=1236 RepID=UPI0028E7590A|nr:hypothetical protein [Stenotrophomonas indicatrix]MDT9580869.1 hypothetical protein [Stenotrophomonas indicatrix]